MSKSVYVTIFFMFILLIILLIILVWPYIYHKDQHINHNDKSKSNSKSLSYSLKSKGYSCENDSECDVGLICSNNNICIVPGTCNSSLQCPHNHICQSNLCVPIKPINYIKPSDDVQVQDKQPQIKSINTNNQLLSSNIIENSLGNLTQFSKHVVSNLSSHEAILGTSCNQNPTTCHNLGYYCVNNVCSIHPGQNNDQCVNNMDCGINNYCLNNYCVKQPGNN